MDKPERNTGNTFSHRDLPSATGRYDEVEFTTTQNRHVEGNMHGFRYAVPKFEPSATGAAGRSAAGGAAGATSSAPRRRRDI